MEIIFKKPPLGEIGSLNPLVPDARYNKRPDKQVSLQIKQIEATLQLSCGFLILAP